MVTHFVIGTDPVGMTHCGGNIFVDVPRRDRVTARRDLVSCLGCLLLLDDEPAPPQDTIPCDCLKPWCNGRRPRSDSPWHHPPAPPSPSAAQPSQDVAGTSGESLAGLSKEGSEP